MARCGAWGDSARMKAVVRGAKKGRGCTTAGGRGDNMRLACVAGDSLQDRDSCKQPWPAASAPCGVPNNFER